MPETNKTSPFTCRFLSPECLTLLHSKFIEAFSDYVFPFQMSEDQFRNHINLNAVDLSSSLGCFADDEMIGFSLNGFGMWEGVSTVYDAGTGVIPPFRRRGASRAMFEWMLPEFHRRGIRQFLLEVITTNEPAVRLYETLGFRTTRKLLLLEAPERMSPGKRPADDIEIRELTEFDRARFESFWDGRPSWQNSSDAVERSRRMKRILAAFLDGKCVGYIVFSAGFGRIAQLAVAKDHRGRGIGTRLLHEMQGVTEPEYPSQVINADNGLSDAVQFLKNRGFREKLAQYEMILQLY